MSFSSWKCYPADITTIYKWTPEVCQELLDVLTAPTEEYFISQAGMASTSIIVDVQFCVDTIVSKKTVICYPNDNRG